MKRLVQFPSHGGEVILVEVDELGGSGGPVTRGLPSPSGVIEQAKNSFEASIEKAKPMAEAVINMLKSLDPDEATVEFGLALNAQAGAILAAAGSTVHYTVTVTWRKPQEAKK